VAVPTPGIAFRLLDGSQAAAHEDDLLALHDEVYDQPGDAAFARQFRVWRRQPGFVLAEARHGGYLVAYACGMPLRPSTSWWKDLTTPLPADVTTEHPGRTFALTGLLVRASWRRQSIARSLHDLILAGRPEERATLTVPPTATSAQHAFRRWGWQKVARTRSSDPGAPVLDVLITDLRGRLTAAVSGLRGTAGIKGEESAHSSPLSIYSAPGGLRQDPGRAAE
jgi:ribosomal protein S18 acetylase RimI-like enzyme